MTGPCENCSVIVLGERPRMIDCRDCAQSYLKQIAAMKIDLKGMANACWAYETGEKVSWTEIERAVVKWKKKGK
jgi:hypothetical protein